VEVVEVKLILKRVNLEVLVVEDLDLITPLPDLEIPHQHHHHKEVMGVQVFLGLLQVILEAVAAEHRQ
jgi:hypothetical protein